MCFKLRTVLLGAASVFALVAGTVDASMAEPQFHGQFPPSTLLKSNSIIGSMDICRMGLSTATSTATFGQHVQNQQRKYAPPQGYASPKGKSSPPLLTELFRAMFRIIDCSTRRRS